MKKIYLFIIYTFSIFSVSHAQSVAPLSFEEVIKVNKTNESDTTSKEQIYSAIIEWIGTNYQSAKTILEIQDKDNGLIILNALFDFKCTGLSGMHYSGVIKYKMKIQVRDGRFKVTIGNFTHEAKKREQTFGLLTTLETRDKALVWGQPLKLENKIWKDAKNTSKKYAENMFLRLSQINFNKASQKNEDDW